MIGDVAQKHESPSGLTSSSPDKRFPSCAEAYHQLMRKEPNFINGNAVSATRALNAGLWTPQVCRPDALFLILSHSLLPNHFLMQL